jgi:hypothetical protein
MQLDQDSQPLMALIIPGKGQYQWITFPMGLLGCPMSFQWLKESVLHSMDNAIVYIDDLINTESHEQHLKILE